MSEEKRKRDKVLADMFPNHPEIAECFIGILDVIAGSVATAEPQLIQGYTAEQWQEIIDGGYLCEAKDVSSRKWVPVILKKVDNDDDSHPFKIKYSASSAVADNEDHDWQEFCRPAQIKGVMRPIFVEPVDKEAYCAFLSTDINGEIEAGVCAVVQWNKVLVVESTYAYIEL